MGDSHPEFAMLTALFPETQAINKSPLRGPTIQLSRLGGTRHLLCRPGDRRKQGRTTKKPATLLKVIELFAQLEQGRGDYRPPKNVLVKTSVR